MREQTITQKGTGCKITGEFSEEELKKFEKQEWYPQGHPELREQEEEKEVKQ